VKLCQITLVACVRYNRLTSVPESLSNCVHMDEFNVEGNNISQLPVGRSVCVGRLLLANKHVLFASELGSVDGWLVTVCSEPLTLPSFN